MLVEKSNIRIGTAGWNYKDWYGIVYPEKPDKQFKELDFLANYFDTVEINSTFYRPANSFMGAAWVRKVAHNSDFLFTAKLWQRFTHQRKAFGSEEVTLYKQGIDPLAQAGKLGAILCQFPWSYKNDEVNRGWLQNVLKIFQDYPLVVELRHASWDNPAIHELLDRQDVGFATIDQPVIGQSIGFNPVRTGRIGYVRMHGRNYKAWFVKKTENTQQRKSPAARYDYLYSQKEINEIAEKVNKVADGAHQTFVIQNNHPWGQAVANSLQLKAALGEADIKVPDTMLNRFPELKEIAQS